MDQLAPAQWIGKRESSRVIAFRIATLAVTAVLLVGALLVSSVSNGWNRAQSQAEADARTLTDVLEAYVGGAIHEIDLALLTSVDEITRMQSGRGIDEGALEAYLQHQQSRLPLTIAFRIADQEGVIRYGPEAHQSPLTSIADRTDFILQRDTHPNTLVIGPPIRSRLDQRWVMRLSRTLTKADGSFAGIVYALVSLDKIKATFSRINPGTLTSVLMYDRIPIIYARWPDPANAETYYGTRSASPQLAELLAQGVDQGGYEAICSSDGLRRVFYVKRLAAYPLFVSVGLANEDVFRDWRQLRNNALWQFGLIATLLVALAIAIHRSWRRRERGLTAEVLHQTADADRLRSLLDTSPIAVRIATEGGRRIVYANRSYALLTKLAAERVLGSDPRDHYADKTVFDKISERLKTQPAVESELVGLRIADDATRWASASYFSITFGGEVAILGWFYDVTDIMTADTAVLAANRQLESQSKLLERSNSELEQFAYVASHDLREPLRMVSSYLSLLERRYGEAFDQDGHDFLGFARDGAKRMDQLVLDLLEYSRVGRFSGPIIAMPVFPVLELALINLEMAITNCGATISVDDGIRDSSVMADQGQIMRLFQNLIANGLKYRQPDVAPAIRIGGRRTNGDWEFSVADNGIGIESEYFERIFGIFQRLHTRDQFDGTGIGLAICKKIIDDYDGRIWLESIPGKGTTFFFTLREARAADRS